MREIQGIHTTYEEIIQNLDKYIDKFLNEAIVGFKSLNLTEQQQRTLLCKIGDKLNFLPNSKYPKGHRYVEAHDNALSIFPNKSKDELVVLWHIEHCSVTHSPFIGVWNMTKHNCSSESGNTLFIDSWEIYKKFPKPWQDFLDKCEIMDIMRGKLAENFDENSEFNSLDGHTYKSVPRKAIFTDPITGIKSIRINCILVYEKLVSFDGRKPTVDEQNFLNSIIDIYRSKIYNDQDTFCQYWSWEKGDLLIPNLSRMLHAVRGGFNYGEREFVGYWGYPQGAEESFPDLLWDTGDPDYILQ